MWLIGGGKQTLELLNVVEVLIAAASLLVLQDSRQGLPIYGCL